MGKYATESAAAMLRGMGFHARAHSPADERILKLGRSQTLGKECLPMILTTGMLLNTIQSGKPGGNLLFCMPTASGPCRLGQYEVYMKDLIARLEIPDAAIFSLSSGGSYGGLGAKFQKGLWWSVLISDAIEDLRSVLLANAVEVDASLALLDREWQLILSALESGNYMWLTTVLSRSAGVFRSIPMKLSLNQLPVISLVGEIFVRRDSLSRRFLTERLAESGFAVICSPIAEWLFYIDFMVANGFLKKKLSRMEMLEARYRKNFMVKYEHIVQSIFRSFGHYRGNPVDIESILNAAAPFISLDLAGEGILTVGSALTHIASLACGVIAIGPFGCMPNRIAEAILNKTMNVAGKRGTDPENQDLRSLLTAMDHLPFLALESDGRPFSQIVEAKLEAFLLGAKRLHDKMMNQSKQKRKPELPIAYSA
jgi:predicted nucleotide-binding protein (sugar kinase/HSP70/actin superfamily)